MLPSLKARPLPHFAARSLTELAIRNISRVTFSFGCADIRAE